MKFFCLFFFIIGISITSLFGQTAKIDSLKSLIKEAKEDTTTINNLIKLTGEIRRSNPTHALPYAQQALELSKKINWKKGQVKANYMLAVCHYLNSNFEMAKSYNRNAINLASEIPLPLHLSDAYNLMGSIYTNMGDVDESLKHLLLSVKTLEENGLSEGIEYAYMNIGANYYDRYDYETAKKYYQLALPIAEENQDSFLMATLYSNLSSVVDSVGFAEKAVEIALKVQDFYTLENAYVNIGAHYFKKLKDPNTAKNYYYKALVYADSLNDGYFKSKILSNIGECYLELNVLDSSEVILLQASQLAREFEFREVQRDVNYNLAKLYEKKGGYESSLDYFKIYDDIKDSLYTASIAENISKFNAEFESEQKEKQIIQQQLEIANEKNRSNRFLLGGILALLAASAIYFWYYVAQSRKKRKAEIALQKQTIETQNLRELDQLKSNFFANISHEFRTPLTLMLGPLEDMIKGSFKGNRQTYFRMMQRNGKRLLVLINQLLDLSKLESGQMKLRAVRKDIAAYIKAFAFSFESLAESREIDYKVAVPGSPVLAYFDPDKLEKILSNLLGNAFKFTPDGGQIELELDQNDTHVVLSVKDSGIGIPQSDLPHIFDRFYQVDSSTTKERSGSGIGLALTKELVELHKGSIEVASAQREGTTFVLSFPLGESHLNASDIVKEVPASKIAKAIKYDTDDSKAIPYVPAGNRSLVLLVEDNADLRQFIKDKLQDQYEVLEAENGKVGLGLAHQQIPDLIISDVMMPQMDGYEFCKQIKTDERTSHVPVVMLTAKADLSDKLEGLETGADDYLTKPFNGEELLTRMSNLIEQRRKLREKFKGQGFQLREVAVNSVDEQFLNKLKTIIEANLEDELYSIEDLADEMHLSRRQLLRKTKALTGQAPSVLIRTLRLQRAKELLEKGVGNVTEIAIRTGFNSQSYFTKCFKEQFGEPPTEFLKD